MKSNINACCSVVKLEKKKKTDFEAIECENFLIWVIYIFDSTLILHVLKYFYDNEANRHMREVNFLTDKLIEL